MYELLVPKENVNDEEVTIIQIFFENNSKVKQGDSIFEIETTKVNIDIEAPISGTLLHKLKEGDVLKIGHLLAHIDDGSSEALHTDEDTTPKKGSILSSDVQVSKAALKRAEELNVDISKIKKGMITISDIEQMADKSIKENSIIIIGGGGHAKTCIDILLQTKEYEILGILDPKLKVGDIISGIKVLGDNSYLNELVKRGLKYGINGVGATHNPVARKKVFTLLKEYKIHVPNIIHPSANIEPSAKIGEGNQFMMGSMVGSDSIVGNNCLVNSGSIISHDCILNDHCHIAPGAVLAGSVEIGKSTLIGMGSTIYIGNKIGNNSVIYNGLNIFNDVKDNSIVEK